MIIHLEPIALEQLIILGRLRFSPQLSVGRESERRDKIPFCFLRMIFREDKHTIQVSSH